ncbi:MAG: ASKHA domain-containing protein [candidate division WOR-3 bacterium]
MSDVRTILPQHGKRLSQLLAEVGVVVRSECGGKGKCGRCRVQIQDRHGRRVVLACQFVPVEPVTVVSSRPRAGSPPFSMLGVEPPASGVVCRLAADIGTTTISLAAVDVLSRRVVRRRELLNPQIVFGFDVMSRIARERKVRRAAPVKDVLTGFMRQVGIAPREPATVVGNTVMIHFLFDRSPAGLGHYPYRSKLPLKRMVRQGRIRVLPLLGSFVGSDCTAAILASGMHRSKRLALLVDAGTNGEVVLGNSERLLVCSTAAGPAFEGPSLECGSLAQPGAVTAVRPGRNGFRLDIIGKRQPATICGSGVLDAVAAGLETGRIDCTGRLRYDKRLWLFRDNENGVYLSQADLREVQLAKAAIAAAVRILFREWGVSATAIERLFITGRFGAALRPESAIRIGLLPAVRPRIIRQHPNLALLGAIRATYNRELLRIAESVARRCQEIELSRHPDFETAFITSMNLEPWQ